MFKKSTVMLCSATLVGALLAGVPSGAFAASQQSTGTIATSVAVDSSGEISQKEMEQLEKDVETLFTRYIQMDSSGQFFVNTKNLAEDGVQDRTAELRMLSDSLNLMAEKESEQATNEIERRTPGKTLQPYGSTEFAKCVILNGLGIPALGGSPGIISAIKLGISSWNWGIAAKAVAKFLGPAVVKSLGGPVGIGVALGWSAWSCRGKL